jgi:osmotically-inducible protein OsmY
MIFTVGCAETDPGITTSVVSKLAADDTVKAYRIDVDTTDGVVTLNGTVGTATEEAQALTIARQTDGVRNVVDRITVEPQPTGTTGERRDEPGELRREIGDASDKAGAAVSDAAISSAVKSKFLADTAVSGLKIDVDTDSGVVTLKGTVASKAEGDRAVALARDTNGVRRVVNDLRVKG